MTALLAGFAYPWVDIACVPRFRAHRQNLEEAGLFRTHALGVLFSSAATPLVPKFDLLMPSEFLE